MARRITPTSGEVIAIVIREVDIPNRLVHGRDKMGGELKIAFRNSGTITQIPVIGETWTAVRQGFQWHLQTKQDTPEEHAALVEMNPGDTRIQSSGDLLLEVEGDVLVNGEPIGTGGPGGPGADQNVFIQEDEPDSTDPFLWIETDSGGTVVTFWVGP